MKTVEYNSHTDKPCHLGRDAGRRKIDLYWKLGWARHLLSKLFLHRCFHNEDKSYTLSVIWSFICGYSLQDSFLCDPRTPKTFSKFIVFTKKYIRI